jgi:hypothetical protein
MGGSASQDAVALCKVGQDERRGDRDTSRWIDVVCSIDEMEIQHILVSPLIQAPSKDGRWVDLGAGWDKGGYTIYA